MTNAVVAVIWKVSAIVLEVVERAAQILVLFDKGLSGWLSERRLRGEETLLIERKQRPNLDIYTKTPPSRSFNTSFGMVLFEART